MALKWILQLCGIICKLPHKICLIFDICERGKAELIETAGVIAENILQFF
jgi:hypothetical protein